MAKQETAYKSADDRTFKTADEADRHDAILTAKDEYDTARRKLVIALLANERTADEQPIDIANRTLYCVVNRFYSPMIQECKLYWNAWDWGIDDNDRVQLHFRMTDRDKERWVTVKIDDLYVDQDKARKAVIEARREIIRNMVDNLAEDEANPRQRIQVNY